MVCPTTRRRLERVLINRDRSHFLTDVRLAPAGGGKAGMLEVRVGPDDALLRLLETGCSISSSCQRDVPNPDHRSGGKGAIGGPPGADKRFLHSRMVRASDQQRLNC
jgi:hypothetical protein